MALKRSTFFSKVLQPEAVVVEGSFRPNGSSAIDNGLNEGVGFSVARTGVGVYVVTFSDKFPALIRATADMRLNAFGDSAVFAGAYSAPTASAKATLTIYAATAGVAADIASNANNWVQFYAKFRNTLTKPTKGA